MSNTYEKLTAILVKEYKLSADQLSLDAPLKDLGIDSLGLVELLFTIEDSFDIKLQADPVGLATLGDVVNYVDELIATQNAAPLPELQSI